MGAATIDECDAALLIWQFEYFRKDTLQLIDVKPDVIMRAVEYDFAKWRGIAPETTRATLEGYLENPKKYEKLLEKHKDKRLCLPPGNPDGLKDAVKSYIREICERG